MTHASPVFIANLALSNLGTKSKIESFAENSSEARQVDLWYDFAREAALAAYDWSFARKRDILQAHADDPPDTWSYRYVYPGDCLKARKIENPLGRKQNAIPFSVEQSEDGSEKTILTNQDEAKLVYTKNVTNTALYTPHFVLLLATILAYFMAMSLTGKRSIRNDMFTEATNLLRQAPAHDANEEQAAAPRDADWIRFRTDQIIGTEHDWVAYPDAEN